MLKLNGKTESTKISCENVAQVKELNQYLLLLVMDRKALSRNPSKVAVSSCPQNGQKKDD